jgi:hypothetical protein
VKIKKQKLKRRNPAARSLRLHKNGPMGPKKGERGYRRKPKHPKKEV